MDGQDQPKMAPIRRLARTRRSGRRGEIAASDDQAASTAVRAAMAEMHRANWIAAVRIWRAILVETSPSHLWVQYGHALKEAGYLKLAADAYRKGYCDQGDTFDRQLQMGHYEKLCGNFTAALRYYRSAGEAASAEVAEFIRQTYARPLDLLCEERGRTQETLFLSCAAPEVLGDRHYSGLLGRKNYSYAFAARGFVRGLRELREAVSILSNPVLIPDVRLRTSAQAPLHMAFYPPDVPRLLKGAYNILCMAWEFPRLQRSEELVSPHPFADARHGIRLYDEVWVPSRYAASVIAAEVPIPVFYVPSPVLEPLDRKSKSDRRLDLVAALCDREWVPLAIFPRLQQNFDGFAAREKRRTFEITKIRESTAKIYISVFNPHDQRKNAGALIRGFIQFLAADRDAILLIKAVSPDDDAGSINSRLLTHQLAEIDKMVPPIFTERIMISNETFSEDEMLAFYELSDFYICTSFAEGQNLPLLEAMAAGAIPVSVRHTAMSDYLNDDNSIEVRSVLNEAPVRIRQTYGMPDIDTYLSYDDDLLYALGRSAALSDAERSAMSGRARATVKEQFGAAVIEVALAAARERANMRFGVDHGE